MQGCALDQTCCVMLMLALPLIEADVFTMLNALATCCT